MDIDVLVKLVPKTPLQWCLTIGGLLLIGGNQSWGGLLMLVGIILALKGR